MEIAGSPGKRAPTRAVNVRDFEAVSAAVGDLSSTAVDGWLNNAAELHRPTATPDSRAEAVTDGDGGVLQHHAGGREALDRRGSAGSVLSTLTTCLELFWPSSSRRRWPRPPCTR